MKQKYPQMLATIGPDILKGDNNDQISTDSNSNVNLHTDINENEVLNLTENSPAERAIYYTHGAAELNKNEQRTGKFFLMYGNKRKNAIRISDLVNKARNIKDMDIYSCNSGMVTEPKPSGDGDTAIERASNQKFTAKGDPALKKALIDNNMALTIHANNVPTIMAHNTDQFQQQIQQHEKGNHLDPVQRFHNGFLDMKALARHRKIMIPKGNEVFAYGASPLSIDHAHNTEDMNELFKQIEKQDSITSKKELFGTLLFHHMKNETSHFSNAVTNAGIKTPKSSGKINLDTDMVDAYMENAYVTALSNADVKMAKFYLDCGVNPNCKLSDGRSAIECLHSAIDPQSSGKKFNKKDATDVTNSLVRNVLFKKDNDDSKIAPDYQVGTLSKMLGRQRDTADAKVGSEIGGMIHENSISTNILNTSGNADQLIFLHALINGRNDILNSASLSNLSKTDVQELLHQKYHETGDLTLLEHLQHHHKHIPAAIAHRYGDDSLNKQEQEKSDPYASLEGLFEALKMDGDGEIVNDFQNNHDIHGFINELKMSDNFRSKGNKLYDKYQTELGSYIENSSSLTQELKTLPSTAPLNQDIKNHNSKSLLSNDINNNDISTKITSDPKPLIPPPSMKPPTLFSDAFEPSSDAIKSDNKTSSMNTHSNSADDTQPHVLRMLSKIAKKPTLSSHSTGGLPKPLPIHDDSDNLPPPPTYHETLASPYSHHNNGSSESHDITSLTNTDSNTELHQKLEHSIN